MFGPFLAVTLLAGAHAADDPGADDPGADDPGAEAAPPSVEVTDDGTVVGRLILPAASRGAVDAVLRDTEALASLSPDVLSVDTVPRGSCQEVDRKTRGLLRPFHLRALRCPTSQGWEESLIEPGDFTAYRSEWTVSETDSGTEILYSVHTRLAVSVPEALVRRNVVASTREQLIRLARRVLDR